MNCPRCRTAASDDATSCPSCGAALTWRVILPDGQRLGPYSAQDLQGYVSDGRIPTSAYVIQEATGIQMPLSRAGFAPPETAGPGVVWPAPPPLPKQRDRAAWLIGGIIVGVIVLLVGVATALLAPAVARGRAKSYQSSCLSNIKQLALACLMYSSDYNGLLPSATDAQGFQNQVYPYVRNASIFACPGAPNEQGYVLNPKLAGKNLNKVSKPAQTPLLWEAGAQVGGLPPAPGATPSRHNGGDNVAYADGHCQWLTASTLRSLPVDPWARGTASGRRNPPAGSSSAVR